MKAHLTLTGHMPQPGVPQSIKIDLDAIPREGDVIQWPGIITQADTYVRTVVWFLTHDDEGDPIDEPFAYIVVGPSRR